MAFRHTLPPPSHIENAYPPAYSNPAEPISTSLSGASQMAPPDPASPSLSNKRQRLDTLDPQGGTIPPPGDDGFIQDHEAGDSGADDDEEEDKPKSDKKAGRRKIKIEFIQDKSRRHITFSKRKAGIMKKAYELSTLTGTQVLLLVVSETGLVYTFTTAKLQPLVTQPEGKNLIQACLNAPHGSVPSSMPVGTPIGRSANPMNMGGGPPNVPGGLSISGSGSKDEGDDGDGEGDGDSGNERSAPPTNNTSGGAGGRKRRRASSSAGNVANNGNSPTTRAAAAAAAAANQQQQQQTSPPAQLSPTSGGPQGSGGGPTSPHARGTMPLPIPQAAPGGPQVMSPTGGLTSPLDHSQQQQHRGPPPPSPSYTHAPYPGSDMYGGQGAPQPGYGPGPGGPPGPPPYGYPPAPHDPAAAAAAAAAAVAAGGQGGMAPPPAWGAQPGAVPQYGRR